MRAALRIAFGYFSFLPLQRWINIVGALLLVTAVVTTLLAETAKASISMSAIFGLSGAFLILGIPLGMGGLALRYLSSRSVLHLRPHGRLRVLLGTTLAITLAAMLVSLPILVNHFQLSQLHSVRSFSARFQPSAWFIGTWVFAAACYLAFFIVSYSRLLSSLAPAAFVFLSFAIRSMAGPSLGSWNPTLHEILALTLLAWAIFMIWYWRVPAIKAPTWVGDRSPLGFGSFSIRPLERLSPVPDHKSALQVQRAYLIGPGSLLANAAIGTFPALILVALITMMPEKERTAFVASNFMFVLTFVAAALGFMIARRARLLWLKAGLDRDALFRLAERLGLQTSLLTFFAGAAILVAASIPGRQELIPLMLFYTAVVAITTAALFYLGLSFTRGWRGGDIAVGIFVSLPALFITAMTKPVKHQSFTAVAVAAGLSAIMALFLRWRAMRHWRVIDWRVAQLPKMGWMGR